MVGRLFLSLSELLGVVLHAMLTKWFPKTEIAFPLGFLVSICRIGSVMNTLITPAVYSSTQELWIPSIYAMVISIFGLIALIIVINSSTSASYEGHHPTENTHSGEFISSVKSFTRVSWALFVTKMLLAASFFVFMNQINDHLYSVFGFTNVEAGKIVLIIYLSGVFFIPLIGKLIDNFGKRAEFIVLSAVLLIAGHTLFIVLAEGSSMYPVIMPLTLMGVFYALFTGVVWPSIPLVVKEKHLGAGYGMAIAMQNTLMVTVSYANGMLEDDSKENMFGYFYSEIFLCCLAVLGLISSIWLYY